MELEAAQEQTVQAIRDWKTAQMRTCLIFSPPGDPNVVQQMNFWGGEQKQLEPFNANYLHEEKGKSLRGRELFLNHETEQLVTIADFKTRLEKSLEEFHEIKGRSAKLGKKC